MSMEYILGLALGLLAGIFVVWLVISALKRRDGGPVMSFDFDERQQLARGRAFKYAFLTLCGYNALFALGAAIWEIELPVPFLCFGGVALALMVFAVICIFTDAYLSLTEKPRTIVSIVALGCALNLVIGVVNTVAVYRETGSVVNRGVGAVNLLCGVMLLVILIALGVKRALDQRAGSDE